MNLNAALTIAGLFALTAIIVVVSLLYEKRKARNRRDKVQANAEKLGLSYSSDDSAEIQERTSMFQLFNKGRKRKVLNIVVGETDQVDITIFDYHYTTGGGEHQQTHRRSVALLESGNFQVPSFTLRPESMFAKLGAVFGMQDIDFDSHPEFSKKYLLKSDAEDQVRAFFNDTILDLLQSRQNICIEAVPGKMIAYNARGIPDPEKLKELFAEALEIYTAFDQRVNEV